MSVVVLNGPRGLGVSLEIDGKNHKLLLSAIAKERNIDLRFSSCDILDSGQGMVSRNMGNAVRGVFHIFHDRSALEVQDNIAEIATSPVDTETGFALTACMVYYRFELKEDTLLISSWFSTPEPLMVRSLSWLRLDAGAPGFTSFRGTGPEYGGELSDLKQSLDFPGLALTGPSGWAAWTCCGEAQVSPPDTETKRALTFSPQAGLGGFCEMDLYTRSRPIRAALSFGSPGGKPDLAALLELPFSPAPACPKVKGAIVVLASGLLKAGLAVREDGVSLLGLDLGDFSLSEDRPVLPLAKMLVRELSSGVLRELSAEKGWAAVRVRSREKSVLV